MPTDAEEHSHLPHQFDQMPLSRESRARLLASIELNTDLKVQLNIVDICIDYEIHLGNLQGVLDLLEHRREMMREDPDCDDDEMAANAVLIADTALKLEREQRVRTTPPADPISVLIEERPRFRGTRRGGKNHGW